MRRLFSTFAHGAPGLGLLLLRLAIGSALIYHAVVALARHVTLAPAALHSVLILVGTCLLLGVWTPFAGMLAALLTAIQIVSYPASGAPRIWITVIAVALTLLGPGAWSVDARLYGWKDIKILDRKRSDSPSSP